MYHAYVWIKGVHVGTVVITVALFLLRLFWMWRESPWLRQRWVRVLPHVNDTLLLLSGLTLALILHQYPLVTPWLSAKLLALIGYIILGSIALKRGRNRNQRAAAGVLALGCLAYILLVEVRRDPLLPRLW